MAVAVAADAWAAPRRLLQVTVALVEAEMEHMIRAPGRVRLVAAVFLGKGTTAAWGLLDLRVRMQGTAVAVVVRALLGATQAASLLVKVLLVTVALGCCLTSRVSRYTMAPVVRADGMQPARLAVLVSPVVALVAAVMRSQVAQASPIPAAVAVVARVETGLAVLAARAS